MICTAWTAFILVQQKSYENAKTCYICKEKFQDKYVQHKIYTKVRDHCHYTSE